VGGGAAQATLIGELDANHDCVCLRRSSRRIGERMNANFPKWEKNLTTYFSGVAALPSSLVSAAGSPRERTMRKP
jgi:hypothetical protein